MLLAGSELVRDVSSTNGPGPAQSVFCSPPHTTAPSMINKDIIALDGQHSLCTKSSCSAPRIHILTTMDDLLCVYYLFSDEAKRVGISPSGQHDLLLSNDDTHLDLNTHAKKIVFERKE